MAVYTSKNKETEYTRSYDSLRGMDYHGHSSPTERYKSVVNMYVDYEGKTPCLESVPGYRLISKFQGRINGIYRQCTKSGDEYMLVHAGTSLYRAKISEINSSDAFKRIYTLADNKSNAFIYRDDLFLLDGTNIYVISEDASVIPFNTLSPYIPMTYLNGKAVERRNMLSNLSLERYDVASVDDYRYDTLGVNYGVLDSKEKTCYVAGYRGLVYGELYIPRYVTLSGVRYEVTEIADFAFKNQIRLSHVYTSPGLKRIGKSAFRDCPMLSIVQLASTVEIVDEYAFYGCNGISIVYFGEAIKKLGAGAFGLCDTIDHIHYERDIENYRAIEGIEMMSLDAAVNPLSSYQKCRIRLPVLGSSYSVEYVYKSGDPIMFGYELTGSSVFLDFDMPSQCEGKYFEIYVKNDYSYDEADFTSQKHYSVFDPRNAVLGCTVGEVFDGRIFLSGNKELPGVVFYSGFDLSKNPDCTYFPECDFFVDGEGGSGISSMLPLTDELLIFRSGNNNSGSIFYHKIGNDGRYPIYYTHRGVSVLSRSYSLYDDALFLSYDGICTILKRLYGDYNRVERCTQGIIGDLLIKDDTIFDFAVFKGYIVAIVGDKMYLGDLRHTYKIGDESSYEWYKLSGVGHYDKDRTVYRYTVSYEGLDELSEKIGERAEGEVISKKSESGESVYYVETEGKRYAVRPSDERIGGDFYPATNLFVAAGLLFFGTESGALFVFNTDKKEPDGTLLPIHHTFMGHAPLYEIETADDNLDTVSLTKATVKGSFGVTLKAIGERLPTLSVSIDGNEYKEIPFADRRYGIPERFKVLAEEKEKGYIEKRIKLSSSEYLSPFGVYSMEYRYKIKGRMKK